MFSSHAHTSVPLQLNTQSRVLASHSHVIFVEWFLSSVPLYGMCLFSAFSANLDVNATLKKNVKESEREKETKTYFETVEGRRFWGVSTTLIRDVGLEILPEDDPDTPLHLNIQQCVMLTEKQLTQKKKVLFLVLCVSPTWLVKKQLAFYILVFFLLYISVSIWNLFLYQYLIIGLILFFFKAWFIMGVFFLPFFAEKLKKVLFKLLLSFDTVIKEVIQYNMMVCCTTTWTLGKNIWKIVFIWARTFLLPIKQPSSYTSCAVVVSKRDVYFFLTRVPCLTSFHIHCVHFMWSPFCVVYFCGAGYGWRRIAEHPVKWSWLLERQPFKRNGLIEFVKSPCQHPLAGRRWTIAPSLCSPFVRWRSYLWSTIK